MPDQDTYEQRKDWDRCTQQGSINSRCEVESFQIDELVADNAKEAAQNQEGEIPFLHVPQGAKPSLNQSQDNCRTDKSQEHKIRRRHPSQRYLPNDRPCTKENLDANQRKVRSNGRVAT